MMRVAYVCMDSGVPVFGHKGCSIHCQQVIRTFRKRGFEVELFATKMGQDIPGDLSDVRRFPLDVRLPRERGERELGLYQQNARLMSLLNSQTPYDLIYERYSLWSHAAMEFARDSAIPGILEVNAPLILEQKTYRTLVHDQLACQVSDRCFAAAQSVVCVSQGVADAVAKPENQSKVSVIPNGVDVNSIVSRKTCLPEKKGPVSIDIGFVGTLKPWHGVNYLVAAFQLVHASHPNARLTIVGEGPEKETLLRQVQACTESAQRSIEWVGAVPNSQMSQILMTFDIAVAPYPALDNFYFSPLKILEYMAAGLPVVASRIGQIPQLIEDGRTGILVEPGNVANLASALRHLCDNQFTRRTLGAAARSDVESSFTWEHVVDRILNTVRLPSVSVKQEA